MSSADFESAAHTVMETIPSLSNPATVGLEARSTACTA
jgi:hypothetical protein